MGTKAVSSANNNVKEDMSNIKELERPIYNDELDNVGNEIGKR